MTNSSSNEKDASSCSATNSVAHVTSPLPTPCYTTTTGPSPIWFKTYECPENRSKTNSEVFISRLLESGYTLVSDEEASTAALWLLHVCTRNVAAQLAVRSLIDQGRDEGRHVITVVNGCSCFQSDCFLPNLLRGDTVIHGSKVDIVLRCVQEAVQKKYSLDRTAETADGVKIDGGTVCDAATLGKDKEGSSVAAAEVVIEASNSSITDSKVGTSVDGVEQLPLQLSLDVSTAVAAAKAIHIEAQDQTKNDVKGSTTSPHVDAHDELLQRLILIGVVGGLVAVLCSGIRALLQE